MLTRFLFHYGWPKVLLSFVGAALLLVVLSTRVTWVSEGSLILLAFVMAAFTGTLLGQFKNKAKPYEGLFERICTIVPVLLAGSWIPVLFGLTKPGSLLGVVFGFPLGLLLLFLLLIPLKWTGDKVGAWEHKRVSKFMPNLT